MHVLELMFREVGTYNDMPIRPYESNWSPRMQNELADATEGGTRLEPGAMARIASRILTPTSEHQGFARIASGWGEYRWMFIMKVEISRSTFSRTIEVITGYTDRDGISKMSETIDENMLLYFNNTFSERYNYVTGARGEQSWVGNVVSAHQVLGRRREADYSRPDGEIGTLTMRPEDVVKRRLVPDDFRDIARSEGFRDMRPAFDRRSLKLSRHSNTMADRWLSSTMKALAGSNRTDFLDSSDSNQMLIDASDRLKEAQIHNNVVFEDLARDSRILEEGCVSWGELLSMNPDLDRVTQVHSIKRGEPVHRRGQTEYWKGEDPATIAATIIANSLPVMLIENAYRAFDFSADNDNIDGKFVITPSYMQSAIAGQDIDRNYYRIEQMIETELMNDISHNGNIRIAMWCRCDISGDTHIGIRMGDEPEVEFVAPTFASSVTSPVLTDSEEHIDNVAQGIEDIFDAIRASAPSKKGGSKDFL